MIDKLEELNKKYLEVEGELSKPETVSDLNLFKKLNKEYKSLGKIVEAYQQHKATMVGIDEAKKIIETEKDEEFREIAKKELDISAFVEFHHDDYKLVIHSTGEVKRWRILIGIR